VSAEHRRFILHRDTDLTGVSGTGVVAEGVAFSSGVVALTWLSDWPTSVVFHDRGIESVEAIHGHGGATRIVWLDALGITVSDGDAEPWQHPGHNPVQHRDRKPPWCETCGWTSPTPAVPAVRASDGRQ
jgi:hypothetical protein